MCSEHNVTNLKDYVTLKFRNGSQFDVVGALDSQRGGRRHGGLIDEIRDHEEQPINEIVLPWDFKEGAISREGYWKLVVNL